MDIKEMQRDLSVIKNDLIGRKAVYEREKAEAENAMKDLCNTINSISEEDLNFLSANGFNASFIKTINVEELGKDAEALATLKERIGNLCEEIYNSIKGEI